MAKVVITVPDGESRSDWVADYLRKVANQFDQGYLSEHVDAERHWTSEGVR